MQQPDPEDRLHSHDKIAEISLARAKRLASVALA